jgi:hypothetical protein
VSARLRVVGDAFLHAPDTFLAGLSLPHSEAAARQRAGLTTKEIS